MLEWYCNMRRHAFAVSYSGTDGAFRLPDGSHCHSWMTVFPILGFPDLLGPPDDPAVNVHVIFNVARLLAISCSDFDKSR